MSEKVYSLSNGFVTHAVPVQLSPSNASVIDTLVTMKELLSSRWTKNQSAAAICVTLACLEIRRTGVIPQVGTDFTPDKELETSKFNWSQRMHSEATHSIAFAVSQLFHDQFADQNEFQKFIQDTLVPWGAQLIERMTYDELCDLFTDVLAQ